VNMTTACEAPGATAPAGREGHIRAQDDVELYYRDYGDPLASPTPVLCLAGLTRNSKDFHDLARRLAARRRVVCPDYRGRGRSSYDPHYRNYGPEGCVRDVLDLLAALNLHRVVVVGTSFGGILAMALGAARPTVLAGVVLNDIGPELAAEGAERIAGYVGTDVRHADFEAAARALKAQFHTAYPDLDDRQWLDFARRTFVPDDNGSLRLDYDLALGRMLRNDAGTRPDLWPFYGSLAKVPVLAIRGALSDVLSEETFERMAEVKPDLVRVTVPNRGHVPLLDEPECVKALDDFLADL